MTWIIGAATALGYGITLSDTCVTYTKNGEQKTADILQKAYPLAPFVVGGFAGSVNIGFQLLDSLQKLLVTGEENVGWLLDWIVENWHPIAKEIYDKNCPEEKMAGSHILLLAAHPTEDIGIPGMARIHVATLKSPNFEPEIKRNAFLTIEHIGSGAEAYKKEIEELMKDGTQFANMERGPRFGGMGTMIGIQLTDAIKKNPVTGVSQHLQYFFVRRGQIAYGNNDCIEYDKDGNKTEFKMPDLAQGYSQLLEKLQLQGAASVIIA